mmetsp:Transcript_11245/g.35977  ORF Transcript_11245/g.35977 Transcript_11245/m.35977 type:complete len:224 (-) Transcript_11245:9-680(-)
MPPPPGLPPGPPPPPFSACQTTGRCWLRSTPCTSDTGTRTTRGCTATRRPSGSHASSRTGLPLAPSGAASRIWPPGSWGGLSRTSTRGRWAGRAVLSASRATWCSSTQTRACPSRATARCGRPSRRRRRRRGPSGSTPTFRTTTAPTLPTSRCPHRRPGRTRPRWLSTLPPLWIWHHQPVVVTGAGGRGGSGRASPTLDRWQRCSVWGRMSDGGVRLKDSLSS